MVTSTTDSAGGPTVFTPTTTSCGFTEHTPETTEQTIVDKDLWDGRRFAVPWPGNTYHIFESGSNRAICMNNEGGLYMYDIDEDIVKNNTWLCVETNGYFGFMHPETGRYMGHNNMMAMHAAAYRHDAWELMTVRKHPNGGYQLMVPHWWHTLRVVCASKDHNGVVLRDHGSTVWDFVKAD